MRAALHHNIFFMKDIVEGQSLNVDYENIVDDYEINKTTAVIAKLKNIVAIVKLKKIGGTK